MNKQIKCLAAVGLLLWPALAAHASGDVGYNCITVPPNTDVVISVPFNSGTVYSGVVTNPTATTISVANPDFTVGEFNGLFYVRFTSGAKNGEWFTITANTANTLTVGNTGAANGDTFVISPHWTLGTAFPAWLEGTSFILSTSTSASPTIRRTQVLLFDEVPVAVNRSAAATYFFGVNNASGFWRQTTATGINANNTVLKPQQSFILRNANTNITLKVYTLGDVPKGQLATTVRKSPTAPNDAPLSTDRPVPMSLAELDLIGTAAFVGSASGSASPAVRKDQILIPNNTTTGFNKSPGGVGTFFYRNDLGIWVSTAATSTDVSTNKIIQPGQAFWIRSATNNTTTTTWSHNATY